VLSKNLIVLLFLLLLSSFVNYHPTNNLRKLNKPEIP